jgi:hypothetical protein
MTAPAFVFDGLGHCIGIVVQFGQDDVESYALPGLELIGRHKTRGGAADAVAALGLFGGLNH